MSAHIAVLVNPRAGKGSGARVGALAAAHLRSEGVEVREYVAQDAFDARRAVVAALGGNPATLVVVGGDGTLSGILDLVCTAAVPVTLIPAGTGNDLARALRIPLGDPIAAAALAHRGQPRLIDAGEVRTDAGTQLFLTVAALGFDAKVSARTDALSWPRGPLRYYLALLIELVRLRPVRFRLSIDGEPERDGPGTLVAVGNTASYGGGLPVCAGAEPDDGLLDIVHVRPLGRLRLLRLFPSLLRGRHLALEQVTHRRARRILIEAPGMVVYADGECVATERCEIGVRPAALTVMVPDA